MSEKISRRVFLKATGLAALSIAAAGTLGGCNVFDPTPGNPTLPAVNDHLQVGSMLDIGFGALSGQWKSQAQFESNKTEHYYLYTGIYLHNTSSSDITLNTTDFKCSIDADGASAKVCSFANIDMDSDKLTYTFEKTLSLKNGTPAKVYPFYVDLGSINPTSLIGKTITITYKAPDNVSVSFKYVTFIEDPTPTLL